MDALLIIGGLLLMLAGLVWLVMRAFATSLLWGWGSLTPPITLLYIMRHWARARSAVTLVGLGVIPLVVGLTLLASKDAERLAAIVRLDWLRPEVQEPAELSIELAGQLNGQPFRPQQGELIDGVLVLREGLDFFALRELSIRLPQAVDGPVRVDVLPQDEGQLPEVELSWLLPEQDLPEARLSAVATPCIWTCSRRRPIVWRATSIWSCRRVSRPASAAASSCTATACAMSMVGSIRVSTPVTPSPMCCRTTCSDASITDCP